MAGAELGKRTWAGRALGLVGIIGPHRIRAAVYGTIVNAAGVVLGGLVGQWLGRPVQDRYAAQLKLVFGFALLFGGFYLVVAGSDGEMHRAATNFLVAVAGLIPSRILGRVVGLQSLFNRVGRAAKGAFEAPSESVRDRINTGFKVAGALLCASPLAVIGAVLDGTCGQVFPLVIKAGMDCLAMMSFVRVFGPGAILGVVPLVAWQGSLALLSALWAQRVNDPSLIGVVCTTGGLLLCFVSMVVLELKRVELANYLPALVIAPAILWLLS